MARSVIRRDRDRAEERRVCVLQHKIPMQIWYYRKDTKHSLWGGFDDCEDIWELAKMKLHLVAVARLACVKQKGWDRLPNPVII